MKGNESKIARYIALLNASEFIRPHGEEGGFGEEDFDECTPQQYTREKEKVAEMLSKMAAEYKSKYNL